MDALSRDLGDEQSWQWSTKTVASTSLENGPDEETTDSTAPEAHQLTAERLSQLSKGHTALHADIDSPADDGFHQRQIEGTKKESHLSAKRVAAITVSVQQYCDVIARDYSPADAQVEVLLGLQMHLQSNPAPGIPADLHVDLETNHEPDRPPFALPYEADDEIDGAAADPCLQGIYATVYQVQIPGTTRIDSLFAETMSREAAMDDALFRPTRWFPRPVPREGRSNGEDGAAISVRKSIRKRKRGEKET